MWPSGITHLDLSATRAGSESLKKKTRKMLNAIVPFITGYVSRSNRQKPWWVSGPGMIKKNPSGRQTTTNKRNHDTVGVCLRQVYIDLLFLFSLYLSTSNIYIFKEKTQPSLEYGEIKAAGSWRRRTKRMITSGPNRSRLPSIDFYTLWLDTRSERFFS